ncbi:hypothetical protein ACFW4M_23065 [Streptomyces sp. NPDC058794]|uniref:hypothetical protein n=1 Tax=Streptomyces sp. NPDC058794 TaxID=3346636 RepID=UPI0036974DC3
MIRVDFSVPTDFEDIPVGTDFETAWTELNRRYARLAGTEDLDQEKPSHPARALHQVSRFLKEVGVVYAADCLHMFKGEPSHGGDAATAARGALRGVLEARGAARSGSVIEARVLGGVFK